MSFSKSLFKNCYNSLLTPSNCSLNLIQSSKSIAPSRSIKTFQEIPGPKPSVPLIGNKWQYLPIVGRYQIFKLHDANLDKYKRYGPILKEEYQWKNPVVHLFDPDDFETVFRHQGRCPIRPPNEFVCKYRRSKPERYPSVGLANMLGEEWFRQRSLLAPALLKLSVVKNHIASQNDISNDFIHYIWSKSDPLDDMIHDLQDAAYRLALESICMICLESRMGCLNTKSPTTDGNILISATKMLFEAYQELYYGLPLWKRFETKSFKKLASAEETLYNTASKYIEAAVHSIRTGKENQVDRANVLNTLLQTDGLEEKDVRITILDFISGGIFTVSHSLVFLLHHLAKNSQVQDKLYKELNGVIGTKANNITDEHLAKLPYLKACVKESFRLSSTVPTVVRTLSETAILSGYEVPAGVTVFSHFSITSKLSEYFENPLSFEPERWIGENRKKVHPFSVLPFGFGSRMCAGRRFSELELYMATAKVILNYELETTMDDIDLTHAFILIPSHPVKIKFKCRVV